MTTPPLRPSVPLVSGPRADATPDAAYLASLKKVTQYYVVTGFLALLVGILLGPLQAFNYAGINVYDYPLLKALIKSYYQGLTLHGVLNALVFTQFFISGWMLYLPVRDLGARINLRFAWFTYLLMTAGLLTAAVPLLTNDATVLYTFYPPLEGSPLFYIGAGVMVGSSLLVAGQVVHTWWRWKRENPGRVTPLVTFGSVATWLMWSIAALGIVVEVIVLLIPWSLGLTSGVDPLLARTLFWWTGHPIVYFWVLPAYISWYAFLPRQAGGRVASEGLARLAFVLFLIFSVPVGLHHQYADPNISNTWKSIHMLLTFLVAVPTLLTAFSVAASLEDGARARGGRGLVGWIGRLSWGNASFSAQVLAMTSFIFGGAGGVVNASLAFGPVVHNTAWIPGHFHITVGTATTLTFMGVAFWFIPHLTGKRLFSPRLASWSVWLWFVGMMLFALGMHWQGLLGVPRRSQMSTTAQDIYRQMNLAVPQALTGLSGIVLLVGGLLFFWVLFRTLLSKRVQDGDAVPIPYSEAISPAGEKLSEASLLVRRTEPLLAISVFAFFLVLLVYLPVLGPMIADAQLVPGARLW
ncbi:b(o/a)3-type cytochrome-c oxidase subunit 1 [Deinococcus planocerae]|uniref:b(o/a)3-type cytochrome-c oxidase subunit 1 n=1 Tax=Deinococcus planocerae TaxID=1737569 RepID=UPI001C6436D1|nr:b(o/a)3-type cytochrome-c oxidase subunit 1 [Deinococcus planocerae]